MRGYADQEDLLLGDLHIGDDVHRGDYLTAAWEEIEAHLGHCYALPIAEDLPEDSHPARVLKLIQLQLATARLILAQSGVRASEEMVNYGQRLLKEAHRKLEAACGGPDHTGPMTLLYANGTAAITSVAGATTDGPDRSVVVDNVDDHSRVERFYGRSSGGWSGGRRTDGSYGRWSSFP